MGSRAAATDGNSLWHRFRSERSLEARDELFLRHRALAFQVLARFGRNHDEDLEQVALVALVRAIESFNPDHGYAFGTYAVPTIAGALKRYLRDCSRTIRPARAVHDLRVRVNEILEPLTARLGAAPTVLQLAQELNADPERIVEAMWADDRCRPGSLNGRLPDELSEGGTLEDCIGSPDPELTGAEERVAVAQAVGRLTPRLRRVIELRYYADLSQRDAGEALGVSQMTVSRLERQALRRLQATLV